jgi:thioredoxin 1
MIEITQDNYDQIVTNATIPLLIEFGAPWCAPCKMLKPELVKLAQEWEGKVLLGHINVDQDPDIAMKFSVMSVPTVVLIIGGNEKERFTGFRPLNKIKEHFADFI